MTALRTKLALVALIVWPAAGAAMAAGPAEPAVWSPHEMIIDLQNLPRRYSCDDLWYKFKDVLLAIGARPDMKILPYGCESGARDNSPKVQLQFYTPSAINSADAQYADLKAVIRDVHLHSGGSTHLDRNDCVLLSQVEDTLLEQLGDTVVESNLACQVPPSTRPPVGLTVRALVPIAARPSVAASGS